MGDITFPILLLQMDLKYHSSVKTTFVLVHVIQTRCFLYAHHSLTFYTHNMICYLNRDKIYLIILKYFSVKLISCFNDPKCSLKMYI